jgi:hypothetical protein
MTVSVARETGIVGFGVLLMMIVMANRNWRISPS